MSLAEIFNQINKYIDNDWSLSCFRKGTDFLFPNDVFVSLIKNNKYTSFCWLENTEVEEADLNPREEELEEIISESLVLTKQESFDVFNHLKKVYMSCYTYDNDIIPLKPYHMFMFNVNDKQAVITKDYTKPVTKLFWEKSSLPEVEEIPPEYRNIIKDYLFHDIQSFLHEAFSNNIQEKVKN